MFAKDSMKRQSNSVSQLGWVDWAASLSQNVNIALTRLDPIHRTGREEHKTAFQNHPVSSVNALANEHIYQGSISIDAKG